MKKTIALFIACALCLALAVPAFAQNYDFSTGGDTLVGFGKATGYDEPVPTDPATENARRDKDAAALPPPYFYGSGEIPTDPSNQLTVGNSETWDMENTEPLYYADGSIGILYVAKTGKKIRVYEGEQLANLRRGAGHFSMTSAWDGNVAMAGHNRGSWPYFAFVKDLKPGDKSTYATRYGTRIYKVSRVERIGEYDYSKLGWSEENLLTLITCIANTPGLRYAAICREVSHN